MPTPEFVPYTAWSDVLADAAVNAALYYHAPMDVRPTMLLVFKVYKNRKMRVRGGELTFTVDESHLSRFRKRAPKGEPKSEPKLSLDLAEYAATAGLYHGGQESMLYAVSSTGVLSLGTIRPSDCDTDVAWMRSLVERLQGECEDAIHIASGNDDDEANDLACIVDECEVWFAANPE